MAFDTIWQVDEAIGNSAQKQVISLTFCGRNVGYHERLSEPRLAHTMQAPAPSQAENAYRTCSACGVRVHRTEVHKNRYGQYICKACRSDGVRVVGRHRVRHLVQRIPTALAAFLVVMLVLVLLPLALMLILEMHSYSNAGMVEDLKDLVRSVNHWAR